MTDKQVGLSSEQITELKRIKSYFPYRRVYGAIHPQTKEFVTIAKSTAHTANSYARKGWSVFELKSTV